MIEITVPVLPESVTEGTLTTWCKQEGEHVKRDDVIAELETDKVILEIPAPHDGVLSNIIVSEGSTVTSAQLLAHLKPQAAIEETVTPVTEILAMPSARLEAQRSGVELTDVAGSGRNGRILKEDVQRVTPAPATQPERVVEIAPATPVTPGARQERREPMSRLRQRIAERLLASQQNNAILTTFNEVNMQSVMDLRARWNASPLLMPASMATILSCAITVILALRLAATVVWWCPYYAMRNHSLWWKLNGKLPNTPHWHAMANCRWRRYKVVRSLSPTAELLVR